MEPVKKDIEMAQNVGVQGVPFFVFDNKYAVSGAQHIETFENIRESGKKAILNPKLLY
jgi:protein disulfide-isomerase